MNIMDVSRNLSNRGTAANSAVQGAFVYCSVGCVRCALSSVYTHTFEVSTFTEARPIYIRSFKRSPIHFLQ